LDTVGKEDAYWIITDHLRRPIVAENKPRSQQGRRYGSQTTRETGGLKVDRPTDIRPPAIFDKPFPPVAIAGGVHMLDAIER
jgi:hypothetical protein